MQLHSNKYIAVDIYTMYIVCIERAFFNKILQRVIMATYEQPCELTGVSAYAA